MYYLRSPFYGYTQKLDALIYENIYTKVCNIFLPFFFFFLNIILLETYLQVVCVCVYMVPTHPKK